MLSLRIALRYLFSRSRLHAVNYVTGVSTLAVAVVAMALVCVLSVYNGYVELILAGTERTDADLLLRPTDGAVLDLRNYPQYKQAIAHTGAQSIVKQLRTKGLLQTQAGQWVVEVLGVNSTFASVYAMEYQLLSGEALSTRLRTYSLEDSLMPITLGAGLPLLLDSLRTDSEDTPQLLFPKRRGFINPISPASAFNAAAVSVVGQYPPLSLETDHSVYVPLEGLQALLDYDAEELSALALAYPEGWNLGQAQQSLQRTFGPTVQVLDRSEQHPELSYLIRMEKVMTYLILLFILLLASFNVASSLTMLLIEKRQDYQILYALGATAGQVRRIFASVGLLIALIGSVGGMCIGLILTWLQQQYGLISTGMGLAEQALPVRVDTIDILLTFASVSAISYLISLYPIHFFVRSAKG